MREIKTSEWMGAAFIAGLLIVLVIYVTGEPSQKLGIALRATARWSFLWFCLATYGGALTVLIGPAFHALARRGRDFGLAFASAHTVHVGLVVWLLYRSPQPFPRFQLVIFSIGVFWTYVLAAFSLFGSLSAWLGQLRWRMTRKVGVEYLACAYAFEFGYKILDGNLANAFHYFPLFAAAIAGPLLRITASLKRRTGVATTSGLSPG